MKKNILAVIALILGLVSLALCGMTISAAWDMAARYGAELAWMNERYAYLESRLAALETQENTPVPSEPAPTEAPAENIAYCNLIIGDWTFENGTLTVSTAFAQVLAENTALESAAIVLRSSAEAIGSQMIEMAPGEATDSYELDLSDLTFEIPAPADGDMLELLLEITLSDGRTLVSCGGSWEYLEGKLLMIAG